MKSQHPDGCCKPKRGLDYDEEIPDSDVSESSTSDDEMEDDNEMNSEDDDLDGGQ